MIVHNPIKLEAPDAKLPFHELSLRPKLRLETDKRQFPMTGCFVRKIRTQGGGQWKGESEENRSTINHFFSWKRQNQWTRSRCSALIRKGTEKVKREWTGKDNHLGVGREKPFLDRLREEFGIVIWVVGVVEGDYVIFTCNFTFQFLWKKLTITRPMAKSGNFFRSRTSNLSS